LSTQSIQNWQWLNERTRSLTSITAKLNLNDFDQEGPVFKMQNVSWETLRFRVVSDRQKQVLERVYSPNERLKAASERQCQALEHIHSQNAVIDRHKEKNTRQKRRLLRSDKIHRKMQKKIIALRRREEIDSTGDIVVEVPFSGE
jgi:hypothetical protein